MLNLAQSDAHYAYKWQELDLTSSNLIGRLYAIFKSQCAQILPVGHCHAKYRILSAFLNKAILLAEMFYWYSVRC